MGLSQDSKKKLTVRGKIIEVLPDTKFKVAIDIQGKEFTVLGYISGKMRMNYIKLVEGDEVQVEMSPYDLTKGRITYRF